MRVDLRIIVTVLLIIGLVWAMKTKGDYDLGYAFKLGGVVILYLLFWVVWLAASR